MSGIQTENLQKNYGGRVGIKKVSFSVEPGEILGFVGPNGAGKSTTIKILMGFVFAGGGRATVCGLNVARKAKQIKRVAGYVPSDVRMYPDMRVAELLRRNAAFYSVPCAEETTRLCRLFEVDTTPYFRQLSTGNKKKIALVCALMAGPKAIILDEPTSGLDPLMQKVLFGELQAQAEKGAAVLLSSHNLAEVQEYCHRAAFIKNGVILATVNLATQAAPGKIVSVAGGLSQAPAGLALLRQENGRRVFRTGLAPAALLAALAQMQPADFTVNSESMEEQFWSLYGQEEAQ